MSQKLVTLDAAAPLVVGQEQAALGRGARRGAAQALHGARVPPAARASSRSSRRPRRGDSASPASRGRRAAPPVARRARCSTRARSTRVVGRRARLRPDRTRRSRPTSGDAMRAGDRGPRARTRPGQGPLPAARASLPGCPSQLSVGAGARRARAAAWPTPSVVKVGHELKQASIELVPRRRAAVGAPVRHAGGGVPARSRVGQRA